MGQFSFAKQFPVQCNSSAKASTDAKGLAEEILKSRVPQPDSGGQQQQDKNKESHEETEEERKKREASWRTIKWTFVAFGVSFTSLGIWVLTECGKINQNHHNLRSQLSLILLGAPLQDADGKDIEDEFSNMPVVQQYIARSWKELVTYRKVCNF